LTIGGVDFKLATGAVGGPGIFQTDSFASPSAIISVNVFGVGAVYTLVNSAFGAFGDDNGTIEFIGSGGADAVFHFIQGTNIRDHFNGSFVNTVTDPGIATATFTDPNNGDEVRLDRQTFDLPAAFATQTLTSIVFTGFHGFDPNGVQDFAKGEPFLAGVTVATTPEPASLALWSIGGLFGLLAGRLRRAAPGL
jgi:hypothetical protein